MDLGETEETWACGICGCSAQFRCYQPDHHLVCEREAEATCSACSPGALPGWVQPTARAIETDLEIAALLDDVVYGIAP